MNSFVTIQPSIGQSKGILWDISVEEDGSVITPKSNLFGFVDKNEDLDLIIDSTFAESGIGDDNLLSSPSSPPAPEKDLFGRQSAKNKSAWKYRPENYGKIYNLMTGMEIPVKKLEGEIMKSASQASYLEQLHSCGCSDDINSCTPYIGKLSSPKYERDVIYTPPNDYCLYTTPGEEFQYLTTFDIQSVICAMLNSKARLLWLIGAESNGKVTGCHMSHTERDCLRQGVDFALSTEFVPALDPELVDIKFILIDPLFDPDLYLIEITLNTPVATLYQLSSGRIFYNKGGYPTMLNSVNEARLMLLDRKRAEYRVLEKNGVHSRRIGRLRDCPNVTGQFAFIAAIFTSGVFLGYIIKRFM